MQAVKGAVPATLFRINALKRQYDIDNSIDDKIRFITEAAQVLLSTNNMVEVDTYADLLAKNYDIKKESIYAEIRKLQGKRERQEKSRIVHRTANAGVTRSAPPAEERRPASGRGDVATPLEKAERSLLSLIFTSRSAARYAEGELGAEYFSNAVHQKLAQLCYAAWDSGAAPDASQILLSFDEAQAGYVTQVLMDRAVYEDDIQAAKDLLLTIRQESITKKISEETDPAVIQKLLELQAQLKEKRGGSPA